MTSPRHIIRTGTALAGVAGIAVLAGCSGTVDAEDNPPAAESRDYADGTYEASGSYQTPETLEEVTVSITLASGVITDVDVIGDPQASESRQFQAAFIGGISDEVVGKSIDEISVHRVAGSSLTSGGFNQAIEDIKEQAAS